MVGTTGISLVSDVALVLVTLTVDFTATHMADLTILTMPGAMLGDLTGVLTVTMIHG